MKLAFSKYSLVEQGSRQTREGALLRVELGKDRFGYADIHPCSHGDLPLQTQLDMLANREKTPLTAQSLLFAKYDCLARQEKHSLFKNLEIPESNKVIVNDHQDLKEALQNSKMVKIKVPADWKARIDKLRSSLNSVKIAPHSIRLDFSEKLTETSFADFLEKNKDLLPFIDYIEDPYPYNAAQWQKTRDKYKVRLAADHASDKALRMPLSCDVIVIKPARQVIDHKLFRRLRGRELVITSYFDHPIGQLCAAYVAAGAKRSFPESVGICGVRTHEVFEPTQYSKRLVVNNGHLELTKKGHGWGFDDLLKGTKWVLL